MDASSNGLHMKELIANLCFISQTKLKVGSVSLQSLSTSIKIPEERFNNVHLSAICEDFDSRELSAVHWCPVPKLLSNALTKDNIFTAYLLLEALGSRKHDQPS